jgi:hypothetical protein
MIEIERIVVGRAGKRNGIGQEKRNEFLNPTSAHGRQRHVGRGAAVCVFE